MSMVPIATTTLGSAGAVTFSSIPQTFTHLQVRYYVRSDIASTAASVFSRFNGDGGSNYAYHTMFGDGTAVTSVGSTASTVIWTGNMPGASVTSNFFACGVVDIFDYADTNKNKVVRAAHGYDANGSGQVYLASSLWLNTAAVTSILFVSGGGANFVAGSRFDLYGVSASSTTGA